MDIANVVGKSIQPKKERNYYNYRQNIIEDKILIGINISN